MDKTGLLIAKGIGAILVTLALWRALFASIHEVFFFILMVIGIFLLALPKTK